MLTIKEIVKDTKSTFSHACDSVLYYVVDVNGEKYQFPIDMNNKEDVGTSTFFNEYKSITLMRYIRKAIESDNLIKVR